MYVLYHKKTRPTGRKIKDALGLPGRWKSPITTDSIAVRWGTAQFPNIPSKIQSAAGIARAGNKLVSFQCFARDGVPHPEFSVTFPQGAASGTDTWFGRKTHGMCGTDIKPYTPGGPNYTDGDRHDFYSKHIPNTREYRIHVFRETVLGVMGKYLDFPDQAGDGFIKNYSHGYRFRTPDKQIKADRTDAAIAAVKSLGLDFGAVDLIVGEDGNPYVLEVNTAPALFPLTFDKYITAFKGVLGG